MPGARYFITAVTGSRRKGLADFPIWANLLGSVCREQADVWAMVLMPDHFHSLFVLPEAATPGSVVRGLKGPATPILREAGMVWQANFFEHRLRPEEDSEPYLRYMLANPYRDGLVEFSKHWPFWAITSPNANWFARKYPKQIPEPEWLDRERPWEKYETR